MSSDTFPILYFNMAGEMIYIIDQRLLAQNIDRYKATKVLNEIALAVFNSKLVAEIFRPHNTITFETLRTIFEKLVHSSIMRLNEQSMNKLFDLMIMVVKYQIYSCQKPTDLLTITDNHFTSILDLIENHECSTDERFKLDEDPTELVSSVRNQFLYHYHTIDLILLQVIRYNILNFLKDIHTRVSIFLREGIQVADGKFVIPVEKVVVECECQIPGVIRYFGGEENQITTTESFEVQGDFIVDDNRTTLGLNIYKKENGTVAKNAKEENNSNQQEIDLLAMLICKTNEEQEGVELTFEFLENAAESESEKEPGGNDWRKNVIQLGDDKEGNPQLNDIIQDLNSLDISKPATNQDNDQDLDLLELMDS